MRGEFRVAAHGRVALDGEQERLAVRLFERGDREVVHRARPHGVELRGQVTEVDLAHEAEHVDRRPCECVDALLVAECARQLLGAEAPVPHGPGHLVGDRLEQCRHRCVRVDRHPDGQDVRGHPRHVPQRAPGDRHPEHEIALSRDPVRVPERRRDQQPGRLRVLALRGSPQRRRVEHDLPAHQPGGGCGRPVQQSRGFRRVLEAFEPVRPVRLVASALPVRGLVVDEAGQRPVDVGERSPRVARGDAPDQQRRAEAVDDGVVVALVPPHPVRAEPQDRVVEQGTGREVHGAGPVGEQPLAGRVLRREVQHRHGNRSPVHGLPRPAVDLGDPDVQRLRLGERVLDGGDHAGHVGRAPQVDDEGDVEIGAGRFRLLGVPDPGLRTCERQTCPHVGFSDRVRTSRATGRTRRSRTGC